MIKRNLSAVRWYCINLLRWAGQWRKRGPLRDKVVCFDVEHDVWHRYLHILILFFHFRGYTVYLKHHFRFIGSWAPSDLFRRSGIFRLYLGHGPEHRAAWLFTDRQVGRPHVLLDADYHHVPGEKENGVRLPMPMVDSQYIEGDGYHGSVVEVTTPRERSVFFFGNMDRAAYDRSENPEVFGCFSRTHLLDTLRNELGDRVHEPTGPGDMKTPTGKYIVLLGRHHRYIAPRDLLKTLSQYEFFLAPSGVVMPLCHNIVEAMCAGCIPILQHPHLLSPALQHGVNCLAFRDERELLDLMRSLPDMPEDVLLTMRRNVLDHYRQYLTPEAVITMLEREGSGLERLRINGELASTRILRRRLDAMGISGPLPLPRTGTHNPSDHA